VFVAIAIIADIISVERFKDAKAFFSYLRAALKVDSSNQTTRIGKTNKHSRKLSLGLLVQSINHFRVSNPIIKNFYNKKNGNQKCRKSTNGSCKKNVSYYLLYAKKRRTILLRSRGNHLRKLKVYKNFLAKKGHKVKYCLTLIIDANSTLCCRGYKRYYEHIQLPEQHPDISVDLIPRLGSQTRC